MKPLARLWSIFGLFTGEILLSLLLGVAAIGAGIGLLGTSAFIIASAALHPSIATLQVAIVGVRFFGISRGVFRYLERLVSHSVNLRVVSRLREDFMRRVEPGAPSNLAAEGGGDVLQRVMGDLLVLENFYVRVVAPVVVALVIITGTSLFIGGFAIELGLILLLGMLVTGFLQPMLALLTTKKTSESLTQANAQASTNLVEFLQGLEDLQATNTQQRFIINITRAFSLAGRHQNRLALLGGLNSGMSLLLTNLTLIVVLWTAIPMVNGGVFSGVTLAVISLVVLASFEAISPLNTAAQNFNASRNAAARLFNIGEAAPPPNTIQVTTPGLSVKSIRFDNVSYSFEPGDEPFLEGISFELSPRRKVAVVGASGAGKTSLINLLLAFHKPSRGCITLDGVNARSLDADGIRSLFSVLPQSIHIFNENVRQNLLLANPAALEEELLEAITHAGLTSWLNGLPEGLDTWIGERGLKMSGGERQRLSLAGLFLQDRPYLLLDEPTASLDKATADEIMTNLFVWGREKGVLLISHNLKWLSEMDEILLIDEGRINERGSLSELLAIGGRFANLYELEKDNLVED